MSAAILLSAALFLPLFPLSMVFNLLFARLRHRLLRTALLLAWPQIGLLLAGMADTPVPDWCLALALLTSALYAYRALALREVGQWTGFLATSLWSLLWIPLTNATEETAIHLHALGLSAPLVLLALLTDGIERRLGAACMGLGTGLAGTLPRLAGVLVVVVLAVVAAPLFPAFFSMLTFTVAVLPGMPLAATAMLGIWLLWTWAGARLVQGLVVGPAGRQDSIQGGDLSLAATWGYVLVLAVLVAGGLHLGETLS